MYSSTAWPCTAIQLPSLIPFDGISVCISHMSPHVCWVFGAQVHPVAAGKANLGKDFGPERGTALVDVTRGCS